MVLDAYQFTGRIHDAPEWVDRNWIGQNDKAKEETGTPLVVDVPGIGVCRVGDYIVLQDVLQEDHSRQSRVEIYKRDDFERLFIQD